MRMKVTTMEEIKKEVYLKDYKKNLKNYLMTSRFNNNTLRENLNYRLKNKLECIYCSPIKTSPQIQLDRIMFVLEMNNDENRIIGIGMVRNHPIMNKYRVYKNENYNRFVFVGKNRIDRNEMSEKEEVIMKILDIFCFKGSNHMKRGHGLQMFPIETLYKCLKKLDILDFIGNMFKKRIN